MTLIERKLEEKEIRINDIVNAAEEIFLNKGYQSSTMNEVAKAAEFTKRTLYQYFVSKEDIYLRVIARAFNKFNDIAEALFNQEQPHTGLKRVMVLGQAWIVLNNNHPQYFKAINDFESFDQQFPKDNIHAALCFQAADQAMQRLLDALSQGKKDGSIDPTLEVNSMAVIAWGNIIGLVNLLTKKEHYIKQAFSMDKTTLIKETFELLRRGLVKKED